MITLSLIVKNEEKNIVACLDSVKNIVDEIVVVDTGSSDSTVQIAETYGAKIFKFDWNNNFSDARNFALGKSSGDWILYLDADESLSENSAKQLQTCCNGKKKAAFWCTIINRGDFTKRPSIMKYVRLFPNDPLVRFEGRVHEQIENSLVKNGYSIKDSGVRIIHTGYDVSDEDLKRKAQRNLNLLLKEYQQTPTSYFAYQLGQTYGVLNDKKNAVKYFEITLCDKNLQKEYLSLASRYIAVEKTEEQNWTAAVKYITASLEYDNAQPLALLIASKIFVKTGNPEKAALYCRKAYEINSRLLQNEGNSYQTIMLDQNELYYHALNVAVLSANRELFNFFFSKLALSPDAKKSEFELFELLLNNKPLVRGKIENYAETVKQENLELVLALFNLYKDNESKLILLNALGKKFSDSPQFLNSYALVLSNSQKFDEAEDKLENSFKLNQGDPSTVFYLISVYLQNKKIGKIPGMLEFAEKKYKYNPEILARIRLLKEKISPYLK